MGAGSSVNYAVPLTPSELSDLGRASGLSNADIRALQQHFYSLTKGEPHFTKTAFLSQMNFADNQIVHRMFQIFDKDSDDLITFSEFLAFASILSTKTKQDKKIEFSFKVYDHNNDGYITADDLSTTMGSLMREHKLPVSPEQLQEMAENTINDINSKEKGKISYDEFSEYFSKKPQLLSFLTVNISNIVLDVTKTTGMVFATPR